MREIVMLRQLIDGIEEMIEYRQDDLVKHALERCKLYQDELKKGNNAELYAGIDDVIKKLQFFHSFGSNKQYMDQLNEVRWQLVGAYYIASPFRCSQ
eukprot:UN08287